MQLNFLAIKAKIFIIQTRKSIYYLALLYAYHLIYTGKI